MGYRSLFTNLFVAGISGFLALTGAELLLRAFRPFDLGIWDVTRDGLVVLLPNRCTTFLQNGRRICTNAIGMRDSEHRLEKSSGTFRILVLGDSFIEAIQIPLEDTFPRLLERRLNSVSRTPIEVISAGVSGWGTDDELTYLRRYGLRLQPDLVLVAMTLHNDVSDNLEMEWHDFADGSLRERPMQLLSGWKYFWLRTKIFFASRSHLYQAALRARRARAIDTGAKALDGHVAGLIAAALPASIERGWLMTEALLRELARTTDENGVRLAVFLIPLGIQVEPERLESFLDEHALDREPVVVDAPQQRVTSWGARQGAPVIDLLPVFADTHAREGRMLYLERDGHWSSAGHHLAAEQVSKELLERGLVPGMTVWAR